MTGRRGGRGGLALFRSYKMLTTIARASRVALRVAPTPLRTRQLHSTLSRFSSPPPSSLDSVDVDDLCLPLKPPYSISDYLPSPADTPSLSRETLLKLHRLSALEPPSSEQGWKDLEDLNELVAIVQAVRDVDTSSLGLKPGEMVDARVRAEAEPVDWEKKQEVLEPVEEGRQLLKLAKKTEGGYFVAPKPENVKRRKSSSAGSSSEVEE
jgi:Asp-tRNA(Asn)/Glu-tRNA(Gln) amidotransferase C subunit